MGRGSKVMGSDFAPDALDLAQIKHRVVPARDVAVVLGYENAVVNDQFPHIAVGDSSWAERLAAPADAVVAAFSPARSTTTTESDEPDSSSDNEHSAPDVAAPAAQEVVDLTLDFDQSDDSAHSAPAPAPRAAKKRKTPEHVEYIDLDD
jgi:molybdopterin-guanine dinucleotide biosynthesis protein